MGMGTSCFLSLSTMSEGAVTIRTKKFITNRLLQRKQFVCEVIHPGLAGVSKKDLQEKLCKMYKVQDTSWCLLFGFKVAFGGCQEVRAQVPPHAVWYGQGQDHGPQAAQGEEEPCQEGAWSQEGQDAGRCVGSCWWIAHGDGTS